MNTSKFQRGTIAMNECGQLGIIQTVYEAAHSSPEKRSFQYGGLQLGEHGIGYPWTSLEPKYVCHVNDLTKRFDSDTFVIEPIGPRCMTMPSMLPDGVSIRPRRDDDPSHDCSLGVIADSPVSTRPPRRSCI